MLIIPIEDHHDHKNDTLIIVLDRASLDRMQAADPAEVQLRKVGKALVNPTVHVCYEEQTPEFERVVQSGDLRRILTFLQRGWKFRPDLGDHGGPPARVADGN